MLRVNKIFATKGNYCEVSIDLESFKKIVGFDKNQNKNLANYETATSKSGKNVRIFEIDGHKLYTSYDKATNKMFPIMMDKDEADALVEENKSNALDIDFTHPEKTESEDEGEDKPEQE